MEPLLHPTAQAPTGATPADARRAAATALASLDLPPDARLTLTEVRPLLYQWLTVLETAGVAELAGLTDDLRALVERLEANRDGTAAAVDASARRAALHRVGLSIERVAALGGGGALTGHLLHLGRALVKAGEPT